MAATEQSVNPARPNRAERRAAARGRGAPTAAMPVPRSTGRVDTRARGGAPGAPRRTG